MEQINTEKPVVSPTVASIENKIPEGKKPFGIDARLIAIFIIGALIILGGMIVMAGTNATKVLLETNMGNITIELSKDMPITAGNFEKLVKQGFYDGVIFHRVMDGFMIQGGDPTGTGMGGPGYSIKDEFTDHNKNDRGTISMAKAGPNTGGSQFFINLVDNNYLDSKHSVFGKVVEGMEVVDNIGKVKTDSNDRPISEVKIIKARII
jgi:peptidylprolyl isomerase